jgi:hypothetical protein
MLHHPHAALAILMIVLVASCFVVWLIAMAPEGHENEDGFHHGKKDRPETSAARTTTAPVSAAQTSVGAETVKTA